LRRPSGAGNQRFPKYSEPERLGSVCRHGASRRRTVASSILGR
jgi:hypothetical protein